jgi:hypothetical protein
MNNTREIAKTCPLCGGDNQCAVAAGKPHESCWCWNATMDPEALAQAVDYADSQCLCAACGTLKDAGAPVER